MLPFAAAVIMGGIFIMSYLGDKKPINSDMTSEEKIKKIAYRYMSENPEREFFMRPGISPAFKQERNGMFDIDFNKLYPESEVGDYAYACTYIYSDTEGVFRAGADVMRGCEIWINEERIAKTTVHDEYEKNKKVITVNIHKGKNRVFIKAKKTPLGFGAEFGEAYPTWKPEYMYMPFREYNGYLGIAYSMPCKTDVYKTEKDFPDIEECMPDIFVKPALENKHVFDKNGYIYASTMLIAEKDRKVCFNVNVSDNTIFYINGARQSVGKGKFSFGSDLKKGKNYITAEISRDVKDEFTFECTADNEKLCADEYLLTNEEWLFLGVLSKPNGDVINLKAPHLLKPIDGEYWRAGISDNYIRKLRGAKIYGKWSYPIGVVLYGLLSASKCLEDKKISDYAVTHLKHITENKAYADFDMKINGLPSINRELSLLGMLDYCGSCGNALLEAFKYTDAPFSFEETADVVADYIENGQERLENGMFYRGNTQVKTNYMTIWADDLYMSVPFLCRYYLKTGERKYLEDAVNQVLCFKEKLFMPDKRLMSHVFSLKYGKKTGVPWGRGNGWTAFALTELLEVLPKEHEQYKNIISFYNEFFDGIIKRQDKNGMWHQVLDDEESYCETSCTAMFTYAFARGVRRGRLDKRFAAAAAKGWEGICSEAIDCDGDVYGVCCGSAYSFRSDYYKYELPWVKNDTHGTGIVLLAGAETAKLKKLI